MPEKARPSAFRSFSKQLNKIASSTSNSDETKSGNKIDDVPLNKAVEESNKIKAPRPAGKKVGPDSTTVIGNKDLKLKVTHNDAGRIVISLSNPEKVLVQVHVDESVLKSKGSVLKKKSKLASPTKKEEKDRPKKKASTVAKPAKKSSTIPSATTKKHSSRSKRSEPRDLPDEQERSKSTRGRENTKPIAPERPHVSSLASVASSHCSDDDSTRSPLDLNRNQPGIDPLASSRDPNWDVRRQKPLRRQNSRDQPGLGDHVQKTSADAKLEETTDNLSLYSTTIHHKRIHHRQKRLERRQSSDSNYRSTRSVISSSSSHGVPLPQQPFHDADACTTNTPISFPSLKSENESKSSTSHNRALHTRQPPLDDDDSVNSNSRRIRRTLEEIRKVDLLNKGDRRSRRSSFPNQKSQEEIDKNLMTTAAMHSKTGSNIFSKIRDKIYDKAGHKRLRKGHQMLG